MKITIFKISTLKNQLLIKERLNYMSNSSLRGKGTDIKETGIFAKN